MSVEKIFYVPDAAGFEDLVRSPTGEVGVHLFKIGQAIQRGAQRQVGVDTGSLRLSIHVRQGVDTRGQFVEVGSPLDHALPHHEGQRPHVIQSNTGRLLRFSSKGKVVYARSVQHPGSEPNHFLTDPMTRVVLTS